MGKQWRQVVLSAVMLAAALLTSVVTAGQPERLRIEKAKESLVAMLSVVNILDLNLGEHDILPGPTDGLVPLRSVRHLIDVRIPRFFPERDAWGREILYWSDGRDYVVLSYGSDGQPDYDYDHVVPYQDVPHGTLTREPRQDIVIVGGEVWQGPLFKGPYGRATMARMRAINTALGSFAVDYNIYPGPTNGIVPVSTLAQDLVPTYIRVLPTEDEWEHPLLYWSDGMNYSIISTGTDGSADLPYATWQASDFLSFLGGRTTDARGDIVLVNGQFVQWPKGIRP